MEAHNAVRAPVAAAVSSVAAAPIDDADDYYFEDAFAPPVPGQAVDLAVRLVIDTLLRIRRRLGH